MTGTPRVLVATDDVRLRGMVAHALEVDGYVVRPVAAAASVPPPGEEHLPWLVVLDVDELGTDQQRRLVTTVCQGDDRALVLLGSGDPKTIIAGLDSGADDYVRKPFAVGELLARLRAVRRRRGRPLPTVWSWGDVVLDDGDHRVTRAGQSVDLTVTEFRLLRALLLHPDRVFSKRDLLGRAWHYTVTNPALVEFHVSHLRGKLNAFGPDVIETVRGAGYRLARPPVSDDHPSGSMM